MMASRRVCALVSVASVATTTSVVFSPGWPLVRKLSACRGTAAGRPRPPNSLLRSNGAAQKCGPPPITAEPAALTIASAPTVMPSRGSADAEPSAALQIRRWSRQGPRPRCRARNPSAACAAAGIAELAIGRIAAPILVAAVQQIEQDRARHDRHKRLADRKAAALFAQPGLHAGGGVEAERRAAGKRDGVDPLDRHRGIEQRALARAGPAAAKVGGRDRGLVEHHRGDARAELWVVGMPDADARDIGDEIARHSGLQRTRFEP